MKIVLVNSVGINDRGDFIIHSPSRWCEAVKEISRWFAYYPWEIAYLSSLLKEQTGHNIKFIDGCLEKLSKERYYKKILSEKPDWLITECSSVTIRENLWIAKKIKKELGTVLVFTGQHACAFPQELVDEGIDYVAVGEYEYAVLELLKNRNKKGIKGLWPNAKRKLIDINELPFPEDEDVRRIDYSYPGEPCSEFREIEVFASRGCPFNCSFCVARNLYYGCGNWRPRNIENIIEEIKYLKNKYPKTEGIFFNEEVHNGNNKFILELSKAIINNKLDFLCYEALCDLRLLNEEILYAMKQAGYYKVRIGLESASSKVLDSIGKKMDLSETEEKLNTCRNLGIKTYGTFMFGSQGSSLKEDKKTVEFIKYLICNKLLNDVQISICTPFPGTPFYKKAKQAGYLKNENFSLFNGGSNSVLNYPEYSSSDINKMMKIALTRRDRAILKNKIKDGKLFQWLIFIIRKYGVILTFFKFFKRLKQEINLSIINYECKLIKKN